MLFTYYYSPVCAEYSVTRLYDFLRYWKKHKFQGMSKLLAFGYVYKKQKQKQKQYQTKT